MKAQEKPSLPLLQNIRGLGEDVVLEGLFKNGCTRFYDDYDHEPT